MQLVFDGHNDVLLRLWRAHAAGVDPVRQFINGTREGHIDAPRARRGGLGGGLCAIYIPSDGEFVLTEPDDKGHYNTPVDKPLARASSLDIALQMAAIALRVERAGGWRLCRSTSDIRAAMAEGVFAAVLHMEGCEAIDADLAALEVFYQAGLRTLGPVWSRPNIFGHGVPFAFPMSPDTGPGLTTLGFELVKACDRLGIALDLAHITEKGFWDVAKTSDKPLIASHSNAHALTPVARNLTDRQMDAIRERKGIAGLNYAVTMLRSDARDFAETPLSDMVRHIDYMVERMGIDCVGLGSDFDGCTVPGAIGDASGNQRLLEALQSAGYGDADIAKIARENWLRVLGTTWGE
ncbi:MULTISPECIES: dipeptidase [Rhizobium/Agrobacterium group]|uniref:Dipeptidase n=2 Tax=Rhizobium/Agrobacterium group TaxID=227290 RepID=B9JSW2_ALLAM|nr:MULTISPECIES: dipeptidase [Rhizobium/Agrobacterium group]ACM37805.1 dipeptidase [Allorhizobium ampelinum S4]MCF1447468.1 peptidase [Allorhizobium ampelinum]MUO29269.1 peptidase [Agrobacterium vitis]MUO43721.1 peptidase [Agrobacterium vitis]MUP12462.1 peptidase [Agrobacterium vitis]